MAHKTVKYDREKLYDKVWSMSMSRLAKQYGISDVALAKVCKKLKGPRPGRGYWAKLQAGVRVKPRPKLPPAPGGVKELVSSRWVEDEDPLDGDVAVWLEDRLATEKLPKNLIRVGKRLSSPHPLVERTRAVLTGELKFDGRDDRNRQRLAIDVSKDSLPRALRIMDAVMKALENRGFDVQIRSADSTGWKFQTRAEILGESIGIRLRERYKQLRSKDRDGRTRVELAHNGVLQLQIGAQYSYCEKGSQDGKRPLEEQLNSCLQKLYKEVAARRGQSIRRERERREEEERRRLREEEEKQRQTELKRRAQLEQDAENWQKSRVLRAYIDAVEALFLKERGPIKDGSPEAEWLSWARAHAKSLDLFDVRIDGTEYGFPLRDPLRV